MSSSNDDENNSSAEEAQDTVAPLCTCCQFQTGEERSKGSSPQKAWLESSFVHLLAPRKPAQSPVDHANQCQHQHQHGFLESHQHLLQLSEAAQSSSVSLCVDCTDRVAAALEADTQRLYIEAQAYQDAATNSKQRNKAFLTYDMAHTEDAYREEIHMLQQEVQAREAELAHLNALYKDQLTVTRQLEQLDDQLQQEQIALELQSKSFDNSIQLKTTALKQVETEVDRLSLVKLPQALFDLQVDQRGLRYPLINQLRLAYRPKGDVPLKEIQIAWSQATQLLLILGTLLQYPSSDWKLVPLADCAKLIYRKEIYNLSPGDCRGLMAWNALLCGICQYASKPTKPPPFASSASSIGTTDLTHLNRMDHVGWSQVIHRMASNLLWLSECASDLVATQVGTIAQTIV
jgi:hypothetical protein